MNLSVRKAVSQAAGLQPVPVSEQVQRDVCDYVAGRLEQLLTEQGVPAEAVR